jgi:hypothetical protein
MLQPETATSFTPQPYLSLWVYNDTRITWPKVIAYVTVSYCLPVTPRGLRAEAWSLASRVRSTEATGAGLKVERLALTATEALALSLTSVTAAKACRSRNSSSIRLNSKVESITQSTCVKTELRLDFFFRLTVCIVTASIWLRGLCFDGVYYTVGKHYRIIGTLCNKNKGQIWHLIL